MDSAVTANEFAAMAIVPSGATIFVERTCAAQSALDSMAIGAPMRKALSTTSFCGSQLPDSWFKARMLDFVTAYHNP